MLENNLAHFAPQPWCAVMFELLNDIELIRLQPLFTPGISLYRMHVHWFVTLIRIKEKSPALHKKDGGHCFAPLL